MTGKASSIGSPAPPRTPSPGVQQEMSQSTVVNATKERATAMRQRAQQAAMSQLQVATRDDVARLQASLDRVEAALNDLAKRLPESKPRARTRAPKSTDAEELAATRARAAEERPGRPRTSLA